MLNNAKLIGSMNKNGKQQGQTISAGKLTRLVSPRITSDANAQYVYPP
jgi:hypothetical protein